MHTIIVTGASSGIGALSCRRLADAGHVVFAGMRQSTGRNSAAAEDARDYARSRGVRLEPLELDVADDTSVTTAIDQVVGGTSGVDVVVHNAGHMVIGPAEAFSAAELAELYDTNVLGAQRVNRAVLPHLRGQGHGLLLWVGSSSSRGGTPPFWGPISRPKPRWTPSLSVTRPN